MGALLARFGWIRSSTSTAPDGTEISKHNESPGRINESESTYYPDIATDGNKSTHPHQLQEETLEKEKIFDIARNISEKTNEKEIQRLQETILEKEKMEDQSGSTTEKTIYRVYSESTKIQEPQNVFSSDLHYLNQDTAEKSPRETPPPVGEKQYVKHFIVTQVQEENENKKTTAKTETESETDVTDAVVKIQAGIRGYLTRKALKQNQKGGEEELIIEKNTEEVPECLHTRTALNNRNKNKERFLETSDGKDNQWQHDLKLSHPFETIATVPSTEMPVLKPEQVMHATEIKNNTSDICPDSNLEKIQCVSLSAEINVNPVNNAKHNIIKDTEKPGESTETKTDFQIHEVKEDEMQNVVESDVTSEDEEISDESENSTIVEKSYTKDDAQTVIKNTHYESLLDEDESNESSSTATGTKSSNDECVKIPTD